MNLIKNSGCNLSERWIKQTSKKNYTLARKPRAKLVKIAYKNILPEYQMALFDKKVTSLQMIKEYGVKLER